ncbi:hypothetical protein CHS0354_030661 [Potamilus streckersoni]|uniref:non-specific serine/threonine protein kinase n=1 Tax=Potamilus streckersoni TaxID=2493646 RepID=A0AAE0SQE6_9BIVA|nr:hypothetical protein CHS0354_030661 [Potamilus streckersoni]
MSSSDEEESLSERLGRLDVLLKKCLENQGTSDEEDEFIANTDTLIDSFIVLYDECCHENLRRKKTVSDFMKKYEETVKQIHQLRLKASDFEVKDVIGRGHFGEVQVVRDKATETVFAMKVLRKSETLAQHEIAFFEEERDIMAKATSPWITKLHFAFQDKDNLYLVMEFHAGGDLLSLLSRHDDILEEDMARFYLAEITLGINSLHLMGYVHRDIKPENILLDYQGHIKLADFGSAAKLSSDHLVTSRMPVGTPDYVSPELLTSMNNHHVKANYGVEVDWWSLGICMYEMLYGKLPFTDEGGSMVSTYANIMNYKNCLKFPTNVTVSPEAVDLIKKLLIEKENRLDYSGIKKHPFFKSLKWDSLRNESAPFVPNLSSMDDTSNFDEFEKVKHTPNLDDFQTSRDFSGRDLPFIGFTYSKQNLRSKPSLCEEHETSEDGYSTCSSNISPKKSSETRQSASVEVTLTVQIAEFQRMREKCKNLERTECDQKSLIESLKHQLLERDEEMEKMKIETGGLQKDLDNYIAKTNQLSQQLEKVYEEQQQRDWKAEKMIKDINEMTHEAKQIEEEILKLQVQELQEVISQLEEEKGNLLRKVTLSGRQADSYREQLAAAKKNTSELQLKLDKERRKSRDDQKRELSLLETREDLYKSQLEDKNQEINELTKRIQDLEDLVDGYESQEKDYMEREQKLREKLAEKENSQEKDSTVELHVLVQTSSPSPEKDKKTAEQFKELEEMLEEYKRKEQTWEQKSFELKDRAERLKFDMMCQRQQIQLNVKAKEHMMEQVKMYQEEIHEHRDRIQELQESIKIYLSHEDRIKKKKAAEKRLKDLEDRVVEFREDKEKLLIENNKLNNELGEKKFKVLEQEKTLSLLTTKLERVERQLSESREREIGLRLKRIETSDVRLKLAEGRAKDLMEEKISLEVKLSTVERDLKQKIKTLEEERDSLEHAQQLLEKEVKQLGCSESKEEDSIVWKNEKRELNEKIKILQNENEELKKVEKDKKSLLEQLENLKEEVNRKRRLSGMNDELQRKMDDQETKYKEMVKELQESVGKVEDRLKSAENEKKELQIHIKEMENKLCDSENDKKELKKLKNKMEESEIQVKISEDRKEEIQRLNRKIEKLEQQLKDSEKDDFSKKPGQGLLRRPSRFEDLEDLKQEKSYLETKIASLQKQVECAQSRAKSIEDQAENKVEEIQKELNKAKIEVEKLKVLAQENERLKEDKVKLEKQLDSKTIEMIKEAKTVAEKEKAATFAEECLQKEKEVNGCVLSKLHQELQESNLALSEARSLLSATQRQEKSTREKLEAEIRELKLRIFKLEGAKGAAEDEEGKRQQESNEKDYEFSLFKSQNETLGRKVKELEENISTLQREKGAALMEKQLLKTSQSQCEQNYQLEVKKVEKLRIICAELESQIKDLEALSVEHEKKEEEWNKIRLTYERAVDEQEEELEGNSQRLQALQQAREAASVKVQIVRQQLLNATTQHKADLEKVNKQIWEAKKEAQKAGSQLSELENHNSKLQMIVDTQKKTLDMENEENRRLKEEISNILTENQDLRSKNLKLKQNLEEAMDKFELIFGEKVNLENFAEALQGLHFLEKYKFESTIGQQMKLIDYLQALWAESMAKKKKSGKLFGSSKNKDNTSPVMAMQWADLQASLELEKRRNAKLQEQLERVREENYQQANELLKLKGQVKEKLALEGTMTPKIKAAVHVLVQSPCGQVSTETLLTPSTRRSTKMLAVPVPQSQRMHHRIPHRFVTGLNTRATKCAVCLGSVPFVKQAAKCQECAMVCHPKCVASVPATCGLPTEYVQHFATIMGQQSQTKQYSPLAKDTLIHMQGWLKIPKAGKQSWERRWVVLENNILMLFLEETDANPVDTFDLNPPEMDVTVHSAVSVAELPNTATTDLLYILRLEHEPLTTCWPGRMLYLMAGDFPDKQKWVASLEAAIKNLQQKQDRITRSKMQVTSVLELSGEKRQELNCTLILGQQLILLGAEEGLYATNNGKKPLVTKLQGIESVHQMKFIESLGLVVMICGKSRNVVIVERKLVKIKLGQSDGEETAHVHHTVLDNISCCTILDVGEWQNSVYLCIGMTDRVIIMKYNSELRLFCVRKELSTSEPCSCICIADNFALVGTDKFYQISLEHPALIEFVDKRDNSLAFAAFGAAVHNSFPLAVVKVSPEGLPLEFLLCFHEFGVFVDSKGRRSRPADMKWSCLPLSFAYQEPFLYVTYFNSIQAITVPASKDETRGKQTSVDLHSPRFLGIAPVPGAVFVSSSCGTLTEMLQVCGNDGTTIEYQPSKEDKENRSSSHKYDTETFRSPKKSGTPHKRHRLSLISLDSNVSSGSSTDL